MTKVIQLCRSRISCICETEKQPEDKFDSLSSIGTTFIDYNLLDNERAAPIARGESLSINARALEQF